MNTNMNIQTDICEYEYEYEYLSHTAQDAIKPQIPGQLKSETIKLTITICNCYTTISAPKNHLI